MRSAIQPYSAGSRRGFSLIEVTVALGILSFAMVGIIGLMPVGLGAMRDAIDESTTSLIARRLIGEYQQNAISAITGGTFPVRWFDVEGQEVPAESAVYQAATTPTADSPNLARVKIVVTKKDAANAAAVGRTYVSYIARN
jgi:uncharacterized protein (TIGR02598 family)